MTKKLPIKLLRKLFRYEPETGFIYWTEDEAVTPYVRGRRAFTSKGNHGYLQTNYHQIVMLAHRVIMAMETGRWPTMVDHANGDKTDNRRANLRSVSPSGNHKNNPRPSNNKSGAIGVSWDSVNRKWVARIKTVDRRYLNLGRFNTVEEAAAARKAAERRHGYHANHGRIR